MDGGLAALQVMGEDMPKRIGNLDTWMSQFETPAGPLPVTRNDGSPTCYINCPSAAYLDYAVAELRHFTSSPLLHALLKGLIVLNRPLMAWSGLDRQIQPNNWLLATNPVPEFTRGQVRAMTDQLLSHTPGHVVVWRSLSDYADRPSLSAFRAAGYRLLPARQIYLFDARDAAPKVHRDERRDRQLMHASDYRQVGPDHIGALDYQRMAEIYGHLYLDKYTRLNPQYTSQFMMEAHESGLLEFHGFRRGSGSLDAFIGFFDRGNVMTAPIVGYDRSLPIALGLYRRVMAVALERARERKMLFNMSAGAASFKRARGAVPSLEYSAVYDEHLPRRQRWAIALVTQILDRVGRPLLQKYAL